MMLELILTAAAAAETAHGATDAHALAWWQEASNWVSIGFVAVLGLFAYMGVHKTVANSLDERAQKIADELDEARRLREEAQELLAHYQRRQREAEEEAQDIVEQAKRDAQRLAAETRDKINDQITRRAKAAEEKVARAEAQAMSEIRGETASIAIEAAKEVIRSRMDEGAQSALAERAIDELRSKFH